MVRKRCFKNGAKQASLRHLKEHQKNKRRQVTVSQSKASEELQEPKLLKAQLGWILQHLVSGKKVQACRETEGSGARDRNRCRNITGYRISRSRKKNCDEALLYLFTKAKEGLRVVGRQLG